MRIKIWIWILDVPVYRKKASSITFWRWYGTFWADMFCPVLWIRDILVRIQIRASDQWIRILDLFAYYTFWRYIYNIFERKKVIKKSQNSRNQGFSWHFLLVDRRIRIREAQKRMGPTDPDPQHCLLPMYYVFCSLTWRGQGRQGWGRAR